MQALLVMNKRESVFQGDERAVELSGSAGPNRRLLRQVQTLLP